MTHKPPFTVKRAYGDGCVRIGASLNLNCIGKSVSVEADGEITTADAREFATALLTEADRVDAIMAKKADASARRAKWREREIAAGRMKVMTAQEFFRR